MIVSILQLMGFPLGRGAPASGGENPNRGRPGADNQGITRSHEGDGSPEKRRSAGVGLDHAAAAVARRQEVKPQPKAAAKAGKPAAKAKAVAKPAKAASKPAKAAAKKSPAKPAPTKPVAKPAAKVPAKKSPAK